MAIPAMLAAAGRGLLSAIPGVVKRNPIKSGVGAGFGGLLGYEMLRPDDPQQEVRTGGEGVGLMVPEVRGRSTIPDNWQPTMESRVDYLQKNRDRDLKRLQTVLLRSSILKAHNPRAKDNYTKGALDYLKADALSRNDIQQAKILEGIANKDGSLPDDAKIIYDRMIRSGADPDFAGKVSGNQLAIERTQAQAAADYQRSQPKLSDMMTKEAIMLSQLKSAYDTGNQQNAINQLAYFIKGGVVKIPEIYSGFEVKSDADLQTIAANMLQGLDGSAVMTDDEIIIKD
jgi:hypothetical protein